MAGHFVMADGKLNKPKKFLKKLFLSEPASRIGNVSQSAILLSGRRVPGMALGVFGMGSAFADALLMRCLPAREVIWVSHCSLHVLGVSGKWTEPLWTSQLIAGA